MPWCFVITPFTQNNKKALSHGVGAWGSSLLRHQRRSSGCCRVEWSSVRVDVEAFHMHRFGITGVKKKCNFPLRIHTFHEVHTDMNNTITTKTVYTSLSNGGKRFFRNPPCTHKNAIYSRCVNW